jgi:hypothetical protein
VSEYPYIHVRGDWRTDLTRRVGGGSIRHPYLCTSRRCVCVKAACGKPHVQFGRRTVVSAGRRATSDPTAGAVCLATIEAGRQRRPERKEER